MGDMLFALGRQGQASYVLVMTARIETLLVDVMCARVPKLEKKRDHFGRYRPFSRFVTKIDLAHLTDVIDDDLERDLDTLREIRNAFAHPAPDGDPHFGVAEIRALLSKFNGYNSEMDPYAYFGRKVDNILDALKARFPTENELL